VVARTRTPTAIAAYEVHRGVNRTGDELNALICCDAAGLGLAASAWQRRSHFTQSAMAIPRCSLGNDDPWRERRQRRLAAAGLQPFGNFCTSAGLAAQQVGVA